MAKKTTPGSRKQTKTTKKVAVYPVNNALFEYLVNFSNHVSQTDEQNMTYTTRLFKDFSSLLLPWEYRALVDSWSRYISSQYVGEQPPTQLTELSMLGDLLGKLMHRASTGKDLLTLVPSTKLAA